MTAAVEVQSGIVVCDALGNPVSPSVDREAWKPVRGPRIGSSDVLAIFGRDEYRGPWDVWDRIVLGDWDGSDSGDARRGRRQERPALEKFTEETGLEVEPLPMVHHPDHELLVSDLDGVIHAPDDPEGWPDIIMANPLWDAIRAIGGVGAAEVKVPRTPKYFGIRDVGLGGYEVAQMQHHLDVTGLRWGVFIVFNPEYDDLQLIPVLRDDEWCAVARGTLLGWHRDHVVTRDRPTRPIPEPSRWPKKVPGLATEIHDEDLLERADLLTLRHYELVDAQEQYADTERAFVKLLPKEGAHLKIGGVVVHRRSTSSQRRKDNGAVRAEILLLQREGDVDGLLALDPDDDRFHYQTKPSDKTDIKVVGPNPMEVRA